MGATAVATAIAAATGGVYALTAEAAVTCTSPVYKRQMFANTSFSGTPQKTDCDSAIDQDWGTGAPASGLPSNYFGVRWSVTRDFGSGGPFTLTASGLDGIRVYLDGELKISLWKNVSTTVSKSVNVTIPSGRHALRVDYVNWTGSAKVRFTYAPRTSASVDTVKPLTPTGLTATYTDSTQQTKLTWSKNKEMDLAGYRVFRQVAGSGAWKHLTSSTGTTATSYTDTPPATGEQYEYRVAAFDKAGNLSSTTASVTVTSFAVTTPTGFTAAGTDSGVALSWNAVPGAARYRVVRLTEGQPGIYWLPTGTSLTDSSVARSADHTYKVAAVDAGGRVTAYTTGVLTRRLVAAPQDVKAFPEASAVTLTWRMDENDATDGDYRDFRVYRYTGTGTERTEVTDRCDPWKRTLADGTVQHLCTDYSAGTGTAYRYVVTAHDKYGAESVPSAEVTATTGTDTAGPAAPASASAVAGEPGNVLLTWTPVSDGDLDHYFVLRGTTVTEGGTPVCSDPVFLATAGVAATSHQDTTAVAGTPYCYVVRAVDFAGNAGPGTTAHSG